MKYPELLALARDMSLEQRDATLRQLMNDPRFAAVVALLEEQKTLADSSCALKFADSHGLLAHAAGVRYGMLEVEARLTAACVPKKVRAAAPPPAAAA